ncbi:MAG: NAD(P)/FAD-dependent oxidoreductase [Caldiserica bacterium]|nr:NAD(P)/FAD-dependent oxidoreductase [Caldisericota bacterium]
MKTKYLIIGNSVAGVYCIEAIREVDRKGRITVVSDENIINYSRPLISYYLGGRVTKEEMAFRDKEFYQENGVQLILNRKVAKLLVEEKKVELSGGEEIEFEKLLISCGGEPILPPIEGIEKVKEGLFTFTRLEEVDRLIDYIQANKIEEVTVLGAGLIGLKCTEGLLERGLRVNIIELADRILANTFDQEASLILENALSRKNCQVRKEDTIVRVEEKKGRINKVILRSGETLSTSLLVIAVGVRPSLGLVESTPIRCNRGVLVNDFMQTNIKNIYAAGDMTEAKDFLLQKKSVIAIWPTAARQGKIAGYNMAGKKKRYNGLFIMNSVELVGVPTISFGITNPPDPENFEILSRKNEEENYYRKIILKDNKIVGAIFMGKIERAGIFSGLIREKLDVSSFKDDLLSDDFGLLVLPAEYRKHMVKGEGFTE